MSYKPDPVQGLFKGRFSTVRKPDGTSVTEFIPAVRNRYPTLGSIYSSKVSTMQEILIIEGVHPRRGEVVKTLQTFEEKKLLKEMKKTHKKELIEAGLNPNRRMNLTLPLNFNCKTYSN